MFFSYFFYFVFFKAMLYLVNFVLLVDLFNILIFSLFFFCFRCEEKVFYAFVSICLNSRFQSVWVLVFYYEFKWVCFLLLWLFTIFIVCFYVSEFIFMWTKKKINPETYFPCWIGFFYSIFFFAQIKENIISNNQTIL